MVTSSLPTISTMHPGASTVSWRARLLDVEVLVAQRLTLVRRQLAVVLGRVIIGARHLDRRAVVAGPSLGALAAVAGAEQEQEGNKSGGPRHDAGDSGRTRRGRSTRPRPGLTRRMSLATVTAMTPVERREAAKCAALTSPTGGTPRVRRTRNGSRALRRATVRAGPFGAGHWRVEVGTARPHRRLL